MEFSADEWSPEELANALVNFRTLQVTNGLPPEVFQTQTVPNAQTSSYDAVSNPTSEVDWDFINTLAPDLFNEGVMGRAEATRQVGMLASSYVQIGERHTSAKNVETLTASFNSTSATPAPLDCNPRRRSNSISSS
ncbi:hypothetical protein BT69DRAFT_1283047 [Atractiella rhizophila]|nr:hypothetical protein BT69DRAFT_1283047 [Atractiella rhizophila]